MKIVKVVAVFILSISLLLALINLLTLSGSYRCECSLCLGGCGLKEKIPSECIPQISYGIDCMAFSCKYISGRCFSFPKIIDLNYYLPQKIKENCQQKAGNIMSKPDDLEYQKKYQACLRAFKYRNCELKHWSNILIRHLTCPRLQFTSIGEPI